MYFSIVIFSHGYRDTAMDTNDCGGWRIDGMILASSMGNSPNDLFNVVDHLFDDVKTNLEAGEVLFSTAEITVSPSN